MIFSKQEDLLFVASILISLCESLAPLNCVYDLIELFRGDYLRTIVNLNRSNTTWTLDPRVDTGRGTGSIEWGVGNQVSAEFNLVYRWHSAISKRDEKWTEDLYLELFGKPSDEVSMRDLLIGLKKWEASMDKDPQKRPFAHLQRGEDGKFSDDKLVHIMTEAIEDTAGKFVLEFLSNSHDCLAYYNAQVLLVPIMFRKSFGQ